MPEVANMDMNGSNVILVIGDSRIDKSSIIQAITQVAYTDGVYSGILSTKYYTANVAFHSLSLSDLTSPDTKDTVNSATACILIYDHTPEGFALISNALKHGHLAIDRYDTSLLIGLSTAPIASGDRLWLYARALSVDCGLELISVLHPSVHTTAASDSGNPDEEKTDSRSSPQNSEVAFVPIVYSAAESASAFDVSQSPDAEGDCDEDERRGLERVREALDCCSWPHMTLKNEQGKGMGATREIGSFDSGLGLGLGVGVGVSEGVHEDHEDEDTMMLSDLAALALDDDTHGTEDDKDDKADDKVDDSAVAPSTSSATATASTTSSAPASKAKTQTKSGKKSSKTSKTTSTGPSTDNEDGMDLEAFEKLMLQAQSVRAKAMAGAGSAEERRREAARVAMLMAKALGLGGEDADGGCDLAQLLDN